MQILWRNAIVFVLLASLPGVAQPIDLSNLSYESTLSSELRRFSAWPVEQLGDWGAIDLAANEDGWCILLIHGIDPLEGRDRWDGLALLSHHNESVVIPVDQPIKATLPDDAFVTLEDGACKLRWLEPQPPEDPSSLALMEATLSPMDPNEMVRFSPVFNHRASFHSHAEGWDWFIGMARAPDPLDGWNDQAYELKHIFDRPPTVPVSEDLLPVPARYARPGIVGGQPSALVVPALVTEYTVGPALRVFESGGGGWTSRDLDWQPGTDQLAVDPIDPQVIYMWQAGGNAGDQTDVWPDPGLYAIDRGAKNPIAVMPNGSKELNPMYVNIDQDVHAGADGTWILMTYDWYSIAQKDWVNPTILLHIDSQGQVKVAWQSPLRMFSQSLAVVGDDIWIAGTDSQGPLLFHLTPSAPQKEQGPPRGNDSSGAGIGVLMVAALVASAIIRRRIA